MLKSPNRKISLILIVLAIGYLIMSYRLPPYPMVPVDSDLMPKVLGYLLIVLSIGLFFNSDNDSGESTKENTGSTSDILMLLTVTGMILMYILLLETLGFVITTILFIFLCSWLLGYKNFKVNIIVSILFPTILYYIFDYLLEINLPSGILPF